MIGFGVPFGAKNAYQLDSSPILMPSSLKVGRSGSSAARLGPVTAKARTLPDLMCGSGPLNVVNQISVRPVSTSVMPCDIWL